MILPTPSAPFSRIKGVGEITIDVSGDKLIIPTKGTDILPTVNEFPLMSTHTLPASSTVTLTNDYHPQTGLKNLAKNWIAWYDSANKYIDFIHFNTYPKSLKYTTNSSGNVTQLIINPGNGNLYHGRVSHPNLTTDTNSNKIPNILDPESTQSFDNILKKYTTIDDVAHPEYHKPFGIEIDNSLTSPAVQYIDKDGNYFTPTDDFFHNHEIFRQIWKCTLTADGTATYGSTPSGTGLDLTGASGNVMNRTPNFQYKYELDGQKQYFWIAPFYSNFAGYKYHPHCYMGGGTLHDHWFSGVYEAGLTVGSNGALKLCSKTGVQPFTGSCNNALSFTTGKTAFTIGETLTNASTGATGIVMAYYVSSGTWGGGNAAGTVYLRRPTGTSGTGSLNGSVSGNACAYASAASTSMNFTIDNALTYASNIGIGWTIDDIYSTSLRQLLFYMRLGTRAIQTTLGKGIVNLASGTGFAGALTGSDSIDTRLDYWGTGVGSGTDGSTPTSLLNWQNVYGNVWEFISGVNYNSDGTYYLTKPDGTGAIAGTLASGQYTTGVSNICLTDGYLSTIQTDELGAITFTPSTTGSNEYTNYCDYYYYARYNPSLLLSGGYWADGLLAGVGCRSAANVPSNSGRAFGARLKYIPRKD